MTRFADGIESGIEAGTSAASSRAGVMLSRQHRFVGGGNQTWTGYFPSNTQGIDFRVYICQQGSAATSDTMTITTSAGDKTLATISSMGSALGILRSTTTGLGTLNAIASACVRIGPAGLSEVQVPFRVILSSTDSATDYTLHMEFRRALNQTI